jgi:hypothetical protein
MLALLPYRLDRSGNGGIQGALNPTQMGEVMPAFSFEKISPPVRRGQQPPSPSPVKQRGILHQIVDRFAEARARRSADRAQSISARRKAKSAEK